MNNDGEPFVCGGCGRPLGAHRPDCLASANSASGDIQVCMAKPHPFSQKFCYRNAEPAHRHSWQDPHLFIGGLNGDRSVCISCSCTKGKDWHLSREFA